MTVQSSTTTQPTAVELRRRNRVTGVSLGAVALVIALSVWYARTH